MIKKLSEPALLIPDVKISSIEHDSHKITAKNFSVCMKGTHVK